MMGVEGEKYGSGFAVLHFRFVAKAMTHVHGMNSIE